MVIHSSKNPANAETEIDYVNKKVSFKYPQKELNENLSYFVNALYIKSGSIVGVIGGYSILMVYNVNGSLIGGLVGLIFGVIFFFGMITLFGYVSLFMHKISQSTREAFPKTNAISFLSRRKKKEIDLKQKYGIRHYIDGNELIIFNYDIIYFKFLYIGYNKLLKVRTKSVEPKDKKGEHHDFIAIFKFKNLITDGILEYY